MKNLENNENAIKKYYEDFKKDNPNVIMLFRDNDFYDVYEDDIKEVKEVRFGKRVAIVEYPIYKK